jgi:hypothetical protein
MRVRRQMTTTWTDCSETRALVALLVDAEGRAWQEVQRLRPREREACARAARRLAELCDDPEAARPAWARDA